MDLPVVAGLVVLLVLALAALIAAERAGSQRGIWIAKPLASAAFVALALVNGALSFYDVFHFGLVVAILLCFVGDVLLVPRATSVFRAAIVGFLLGHVAFVVAFSGRIGLAGVKAGALSLVPLVVAAALVARWILPRAPPQLKGAVIAYMVVITAMVAAAVGTLSPWLAGAAVAFWANDILVARDRFVTKSWVNRAVGLPLYYGAMVVFALAANGSLR